MSARLPFRSRGRPPSDQPPSTTCRFFARGFCSRGNTCQFAHEAAAVSATPATTEATKPSPAPKIPCRFFASGNCARGSICQFKHEEAPKAPPNVDIPQQLVPDSKTTLPCSFFAQGACLYGAKCVFSHAQADQTDQQLPTDAEAVDTATLDVSLPNETRRYCCLI
jgi:zinc finger (C-x8-C-x5-C-x3-H type) protein/CCCH zinc finger protein/Nab2-type zinc finger RNA-binding protein